MNPESFDEWYAREHPRMVATILLATGDLELTTEGVDEACARALARWDRVAAAGEPAAWVYHVALNHARRVARRKTMERTLLARVAPPRALPAPALELWDAVASLAPRQRQMVVLKHVAGLTESEIANALRVTRSTVSTTLRDAHHRLGALLEEPSASPVLHPDSEES